MHENKGCTYSKVNSLLFQFVYFLYLYSFSGEDGFVEQVEAEADCEAGDYLQEGVWIVQNQEGIADHYISQRFDGQEDAEDHQGCDERGPAVPFALRGDKGVGERGCEEEEGELLEEKDDGAVRGPAEGVRNIHYTGV